MTDTSFKILQSPHTSIKSSKDNVVMYEYNNKKYYVKCMSQDEKTFKILLSFKLLEYMNIKVPNITTYYNNSFYEDIYIISEECGIKAVSTVGTLPQDKNLRKEIARIIYTADLLGLGDIAMDNIIQSDDGLFLIDFEALRTNDSFRPQNPFGNMGDEKYSIARSFDLHNTKGQALKMSQLPEKGALNDLEIDEESKKEVEERFFSLSTKKLEELISSVLSNQFPKQKLSNEQLENISKELKERYKELSKSKKQSETENQFEEIEQQKPTTSYLIHETIITPEAKTCTTTQQQEMEFGIFEDSTIESDDDFIPVKNAKPLSTINPELFKKQNLTRSKSNLSILI